MKSTALIHLCRRSFIALRATRKRRRPAFGLSHLAVNPRDWSRRGARDKTETGCLPSRLRTGLAEIARALQDFCARKFDDAAQGFEKVIELRRTLESDFIPGNSQASGDGPAQFYLEKIRQLRVHPPPAGWLAEIDLTEK